MIEYAHIDNFKIGADVDENKKLVGFLICSFDMEMLSSYRFSTASEAIEYAHKNFGGKLDE